MLLDRVYKPSMILFAECIMENVRSLKDPKGPFFPLPSTCCRLDHVGCRGLKMLKLRCPVVFHYLGKQILLQGRACLILKTGHLFKIFAKL